MTQARSVGKTVVAGKTSNHSTVRSRYPLNGPTCYHSTVLPISRRSALSTGIIYRSTPANFLLHWQVFDGAVLQHAKACRLLSIDLPLPSSTPPSEMSPQAFSQSAGQRAVADDQQHTLVTATPPRRQQFYCLEKGEETEEGESNTSHQEVVAAAVFGLRMGDAVNARQGGGGEESTGGGGRSRVDGVEEEATDEEEEEGGVARKPVR